MSGRWLISSSLRQLKQEGVGETVRQKIERRERTRMQLGRRKKDKQHVWASNHQLTLFICCVVSVSPSTHCGFVWTHQNSQKKQSERERNSVFLERLQHQLSVSLSLSFISLCVISLPHSVLILSFPLPSPTPLPYFLSLSQRLLSEAELGVGSKRQETDKIKAVSWFFSSHLLYCQERRQLVKTENFLLDVSLHSCCR